MSQHAAAETVRPDDLLYLSEAAKLYPGKRPGKKAHTSTIYRKLLAGKLHGYRDDNGPWMVSRAEVLGLIRLANRPRPELMTRQVREMQIAAAQEEVRAHHRGRKNATEVRQEGDA